MAFDFWEAQRRARSKTWLYLAIFLVFTLLTAYVAEEVMRHFAGDSYNTSVPVVGLIFIGATFLVAGFEYFMYRTQGGSYVAKTVGARPVNPNTKDPHEIQLLNVVKEMSVAAAIPTPPVFILDQSREINAFAAGTSPTNAAVTVTRGTLLTLTREELQGVIGHEMGHVYNGDMKISLRLAAMVMGFFFILYIALRLLQFGPRSRDEKGPNPVVLAALILAIAGALSWFLGSILKAAISRQREYLADACAVQFTRNPNGISGALRKIAHEQVHDMPTAGMAYSHLYLDNHVGLSALFATHPPLNKRIEAIEDRSYLPEEWKRDLNK